MNSKQNLKNGGTLHRGSKDSRTLDQDGTLKVPARYRWSEVGLQLYGKEWKKIEQLVATRTGAQIRSHAQKYFIKKGKDCQAETLDGMEEVTEPISTRIIEPPS